MAKKKKSTFSGRVAKNAKRRKKEQSSVGYLQLPKDVKLLTPKEGTRKMSLDFLPYVVTHDKHPDKVDGADAGELWYRSPFKVHRDVGIDNETVICPKSIGKPCPVCEYMQKLRGEGREWDDIKPYRPSPRALYAVMPIGLKEHDDEKIYVWDISDYLFFNELQDHLEVNEQDEVFPGIEDGKTANLRLKWKEFGQSKFFETFIVDFDDRDPFEESILDDIPQLDDLLTILSYKEIEMKFLDMEDDVADEDLEDDGQDENEEEEKPKPSRRRKKKDPEPEEEEEEEEAEETEEEEEPEEKPKPSRRRKPAKKEEPEEEEEEEEEKPRRKPASRKKPASNKCPHGHKFGEDFEEYEECETCDKWDACEEANRSL